MNAPLPPWPVARWDISVKMGGMLMFFSLVRALPMVIEAITGVHVPTAVEAGIVKP
jgi:hypothetical protein